MRMVILAACRNEGQSRSRQREGTFQATMSKAAREENKKMFMMESEKVSD